MCYQPLEFCCNVAHSCCLLPLRDQIERQCPTIGRHYSEVGGNVGVVSASADVGVRVSALLEQRQRPPMLTADVQ